MVLLARPARLTERRPPHPLETAPRRRPDDDSGAQPQALAELRPAHFASLPSSLRGLALAAAAVHSASALRFATRNALLCARNVEYSEQELAEIFDAWRLQETALQTLLDAQLAFVARVQDLATRWSDAAPSARPSARGRWLLLRQVAILARFPRDDMPVPASPRTRAQPAVFERAGSRQHAD